MVAIKIIRNKKRFHTQALVEVKILMHIKASDQDDSANFVQTRGHFYFRSHLCIAFELLSINLYEFIKNNNFQVGILTLALALALALTLALALNPTLTLTLTLTPTLTLLPGGLAAAHPPLRHPAADLVTRPAQAAHRALRSQAGEHPTQGPGQVSHQDDRLRQLMLRGDQGVHLPLPLPLPLTLPLHLILTLTSP